MFEGGGPVVVAVSGGPDSLCLLHVLCRVRRLFRIDPVCFHFDHGLRPGSGADAAYVRRHARRLGVPVVLRRAEEGPTKGASVEAWARAVRYRALLQVVEERGAMAAAVGHTSDDQAETVLLALVRGGGLEALGGMEPVSRPVVRPLLETPRRDTVRFCRALRLRPRQDPMNNDPSYLRVALRQRVIPTLEEQVGRGVRDAVVRTADLLRADARLLDELATAAGKDVLRSDHEGRGSAVFLDAAGLGSLPTALRGRVVRRAILSMGLMPDGESIAAIVELASGSPGRRRSLPAGLRARRERGYVRLDRPSPTARR
jgi:tRNA(Ile)-lysidine synthetase-like protein